MTIRVLCTVISLTVGFASSAYAATLFSDDFQDAATSNAKWAYPAAINHTIANSAATLKNTDTTYVWFAAHNMPSKASVFTLSATITLASASSNGAGIAFCMDASNNALALQLGADQSLFVYKYESNVQQVLTVINSFISRTQNTVKVSKRDSTYSIFCNGTYVASFTNSSAKFIGGGDVGMVLPAKAQAVFGNIVMTDGFETGSPISSFSDNFSSTDLSGWYWGILTGQAQVSGGALLLTNTDTTNTSIPFVNGNFSRASYRVITSYKSGSGLYGLALVFPVQVSGGIGYKTYSFAVDSARQYGFGHPDSGSIKISPVKTYIHASTGDGKDTLEVLRFNKKYKLRINGFTAEDSLPLRGSGDIVSAGLFVMRKTAAGFDEFTIGGDSTSATGVIRFNVRKNAVAIRPTVAVTGSDYMLFDLTGRLIKNLRTASGIQIPASRGIYLVRPKDNANTAVKAVQVR